MTFESEVWAPGFEPHPWITFDMRLRQDHLFRREDAVRAIAHWRGASASLVREAFDEYGRVVLDQGDLDIEIAAAGRSYAMTDLTDAAGPAQSGPATRPGDPAGGVPPDDTPAEPADDVVNEPPKPTEDPEEEVKP